MTSFCWDTGREGWLPPLHKAYLSAIHHVWAIVQARLRFSLRFVGDEAKPSGALGVGVRHHHRVNDLAICGEVFTQRVLVSIQMQPTYEQLGRLILKVRTSCIICTNPPLATYTIAHTPIVSHLFSLHRSTPQPRTSRTW